MAKPCPHHVVRKDDELNGWICAREECGERFYPKQITDLMEKHMDESLTMVAGLFSNVLWDLHQRAGLDTEDVDEPEPEATGPRFLGVDV
jgi:hypothetical protein